MRCLVMSAKKQCFLIINFSITTIIEKILQVQKHVQYKSGQTAYLKVDLKDDVLSTGGASKKQHTRFYNSCKLKGPIQIEHK